jgi:hypothetical protein
MGSEKCACAVTESSVLSWLRGTELHALSEVYVCDDHLVCLAGTPCRSSSTVSVGRGTLRVTHSWGMWRA